MTFFDYVLRYGAVTLGLLYLLKALGVFNKIDARLSASGAFQMLDTTSGHGKKALRIILLLIVAALGALFVWAKRF
jgi:hypothetical protein